MSGTNFHNDQVLRASTRSRSTLQTQVSNLFITSDGRKLASADDNNNNKKAPANDGTTTEGVVDWAKLWQVLLTCLAVATLCRSSRLTDRITAGTRSKQAYNNLVLLLALLRHTTHSTSSTLGTFQSLN
ncbi:hypothetical protein ElyMa_000806700 [Elysia marginata]|uniref:Uncharacterized protein n=1 Tax=Elysia marginata TaxID=1093978 RepID=A0AAV4H0A9_9GAST|nr:hypothetical protein ElyMa_000806700 [Elysia marginata]